MQTATTGYSALHIEGEGASSAISEPHSCVMAQEIKAHKEKYKPYYDLKAKFISGKVEHFKFVDGIILFLAIVITMCVMHIICNLIH